MYPQTLACSSLALERVEDVRGSAGVASCAPDLGRVVTGIVGVLCNMGRIENGPTRDASLRVSESTSTSFLLTLTEYQHGRHVLNYISLPLY